MDDLRHLLPLLIPIVAIVGGLSIPILYIVTHYKKRQQLLDQNHRERMLALEKGIELPPIPTELLTNDPFEHSRAHRRGLYGPERQLRTGIFWLFVGLALAAALWVRGGPEHAVWALIPIAGGLAKLVFYAIAPKASALPAAGPKAP